MITEEQIKTTLEKVFVPAVEQSVIDLNLVRKITSSTKIKSPLPWPRLL